MPGSAGLRRARRAEGAEDHHHAAQVELVAARQCDGLLDLPARDPRAVLAAEVLDGRRSLRDHDARVTAGDPRRVDPDHGVVRAAEDVLALAQQDLAVTPLEPAGCRGVAGGGAALLFGRPA